MRKTILTIAAATIGLTILTHLGVAYMMSKQGMDMSIHGHIAMALGLFFTYGVGAGLMTLMFLSNKNGHDQTVYNSSRTEDISE
jgi:hypothetical protein